MKVSTEGLTLGIVRGLERSGYKVVTDGDGQFADITKEAPVSLSSDHQGGESWGSLGEPL